MTKIRGFELASSYTNQDQPPNWRQHTQLVTTCAERTVIAPGNRPRPNWGHLCASGISL